MSLVRPTIQPHCFARPVSRLHRGRHVSGQLPGGVCRHAAAAEASQHVLQLCRHDHAAVLLRGRLCLSADVRPPGPDARRRRGLRPRRAAAAGAGAGRHGRLPAPRRSPAPGANSSNTGPLGSRLHGDGRLDQDLVPDADAHRGHVAVDPAGDSRRRAGAHCLHGRCRPCCRWCCRTGSTYDWVNGGTTRRHRRRRARLSDLDHPHDPRHAGLRRGDERRRTPATGQDVRLVAWC